MPIMKSLLIKTIGIMLAFSAVLAECTAVSAADSYPSKPIRLIIPFAAGGAGDIVGRLMASKLSVRLNKQVMVENQSGGGGIVAGEKVAKADPDGYTLIFIDGAHSIQPALQKLPYDPIKSFALIAHVASGPQVLSVHPSVPANSLKELLALAKQKPGQLNFACTGTGSTAHMATELFKIMANIDFKIVQFKGGGPAVIDLVGGHSNCLLGSILSALPHIKSGKLRALGTSGAKRSVVLPDVPTIAEAGVPGFSSASWWGFASPAAMPASIVDRLNNEIKAILTLNDVKEQLMSHGAEVDYFGPAEFGAFLEGEINRWTSVVKKANIKQEQ